MKLNHFEGMTANEINALDYEHDIRIKGYCVDFEHMIRTNFYNDGTDGKIELVVSKWIDTHHLINVVFIYKKRARKPYRALVFSFDNKHSAHLWKLELERNNDLAKEYKKMGMDTQAGGYKLDIGEFGYYYDNGELKQYA